jgi:hypothetical protein
MRDAAHGGFHSATTAEEPVAARRPHGDPTAGARPGAVARDRP